MDYYYSIHGEENNLTKAFNDIALEKLDIICRERKSYQDLNIMMLIPKTDDIDELNKKGEIIGFFNIDDISDLNQDLLVRDESDDTIRIIDNLHSHSLESYYNIIKYINPSCFRFDMNDVSSFDDFKIRLNKAYPNIELDNSYFIQIELNNYFDIFRDGEFQSYLLNNTHIGAYAFIDYRINNDGESNNRKLYCIIKWSYTSNILNIDFDFVDEISFNSNLKIDNVRDNEDIRIEVGYIVNGEDRKRALLQTRDEILSMKDRMENTLSSINKMLEKEYPEVFDD